MEKVVFSVGCEHYQAYDVTISMDTPAALKGKFLSPHFLHWLSALAIGKVSLSYFSPITKSLPLKNYGIVIPFCWCLKKFDKKKKSKEEGGTAAINSQDGHKWMRTETQDGGAAEDWQASLEHDSSGSLHFALFLLVRWSGEGQERGVWGGVGWWMEYIEKQLKRQMHISLLGDLIPSSSYFL